jgi:hypothetical protein
VTAEQFAELSPGLPGHADEVMASHEGRPTRADMAAKLPAVDEGTDDQAKYC